MIIADRYVYDPETDRLGKGGFGSVFKALDQQTQQTVALKFVPQSKLPTRYSLAEEAQRLRSLSHPNLVKYYDVILKAFENIAGEKDFMQIGVMEYVNGGDLGAYMKMPFARQALKIKSLLIGILEGLAYLHSHKIIHRDIKPQNILLAIEGQQITPKIADFSLSKQLSNELTSVSAAVGTYEYMSPEQLGRGDSKVGITTDIWAFGVLMYQLLTQNLPFGSRRKGETDGQIVANIIDPQFVPDFSEITPEYQAIIRKCLEKDPNQRFQNAQEILTLLRSDASTATSGKLLLTLPEVDSFFSEIKEETQEEMPQKNDNAQTLHTVQQPSSLTPESLDSFPTAHGYPAPSVSQNNLTLASGEQPKQEGNTESSQTISDETLLSTPQYTSNKFAETQESPINPNHRHKNSLQETIAEERQQPKNYAPMYAVLLMCLLGILGWAWASGYFNEGDQNAQDKPNSADSSAVIAENKLDSINQTQERNNTQSKPNTQNTTNKQAQPTRQNTTQPSETNTNTRPKPNESTTNEPLEPKPDKPSTNTNTNSNQSIPVRYDYEEEGSLGKIVSKNGLYGFIDKNGAMRVPLQYQDFAYPQEGLAAVKQGNKWGFINLQNQVVIPFRYDRPGNFRNGRAQVSLGDRDFYIDKKGNPVE